MFKRTLKGTFRKLSPKHLNHSVRQFAAKHNLQDRATLDIYGLGPTWHGRKEATLRRPHQG